MESVKPVSKYLELYLFCSILETMHSISVWFLLYNYHCFVPVDVNVQLNTGGKLAEQSMAPYLDDFFIY